MSVDSNEIKNKICEAIKKFRLMKGLTAKELSTRTGIATSNISAIESGERVPKLDMCNKIANALGADPVEICGLELTEQDEKRLLMKLLSKYADNVELIKIGEEDGKPVYDPNGRSIATLPIDFVDFAMRYEENKSAVSFAIEGIKETDPRYELVKSNAEDEFNYWMDMYPTYDAVVNAMKNMLDGTYPHSNDAEIEKARSMGRLDFDLVDIFAAVEQSEMEPDFWSFQSEYIIPRRNEAWRAKYAKKDE